MVQKRGSRAQSWAAAESPEQGPMGGPFQPGQKGEAVGCSRL